jgi:16S rRNA processing protein RimM
VIAKDAWVPLAEIARPHGIKGELRLRPFNKDSDLLLGLDEILVRMKDGQEHEVSVDRARKADDAILMKLHSVDDRDKAGELRGALVCARRESFPEPQDGEFYWCDVIGARVLLATAEGEPAELGTVRELKAYPTLDVLVVRAKDGGADWEVPLIDAYVSSLDAEGAVVTLKTLDGLER